MADWQTYIDPQETVALVFFILAWVGYARFAKLESHVGKSLLAATNRYRLYWMQQMLLRDNRSVDAIVVGNLMRSSTFSANTTILILAGLLGMLGYHDRVSPILSAIPFAKPMTQAMWELKIFLLFLIFIYAYFKYTWSMRQQSYTSIFIAAAPAHDDESIDREQIALKGAFIAGNAAEHFNNGLRAYYFGLATLAWFVHPYFFIVATLLVVGVLYRREYRSATLRNLAN